MSKCLDEISNPEKHFLTIAFKTQGNFNPKLTFQNTTHYKRRHLILKSVQNT